MDAGVDVNETYRRLYEHVPIEKLRLVARALQKIEVHDDGVLAVTYISKQDYEAAGAGEVLTEGIIDQLRTLDGTLVAAVVRDQPERGRARRKVSLRSTDGRVDVSAIAREQRGRAPACGGLPPTSNTQGIRVPVRPGRRAALSGEGLDRALLVDKPAGPTSHDVVARTRSERPASRPDTPAPSIRSRPGC